MHDCCYHPSVGGLTEADGAHNPAWIRNSEIINHHFTRHLLHENVTKIGGNSNATVLEFGLFIDKCEAQQVQL